MADSSQLCHSFFFEPERYFVAIAAGSLKFAVPAGEPFRGAAPQHSAPTTAGAQRIPRTWTGPQRRLLPGVLFDETEVGGAPQRAGRIAKGQSLGLLNYCVSLALHC